MDKKGNNSVHSVYNRFSSVNLLMYLHIFAIHLTDYFNKSFNISMFKLFNILSSLFFYFRMIYEEWNANSKCQSLLYIDCSNQMVFLVCQFHIHFEGKNWRSKLANSHFLPGVWYFLFISIDRSDFCGFSAGLCTMNICYAIVNIG